jgi:hypothetical protein
MKAGPCGLGPLCPFPYVHWRVLSQAAARIAIFYNMNSHSPATRVATEVR